MKPNVSIIILNWNGWKDTIECLESLYQIDYPNYEVIVVEIDENSSLKANFCHEVINSDIESLEEAAFPDNTFDAISMNHVVEHLSNPINTLRECQRILKKGGQLVVTVPNIESLGHRLYQEAYLHLDPPRHLFPFSPETLRACAKQAGLSIQELRTTANGARWMWAASRLIRRNGELPGGSPQKQSLRLRLEGLAFQAVEHGLCWVTDAGEEIVMIASKGDEAYGAGTGSRSK